VGRGIPDELREKVFEPFEQGDRIQADAPGVGVGLSLVKRFAELHGGRAWVEGRPRGGSSFRVLLREPSAPRYEEELDELLMT
jgi:signal transduction histidine kinase